MITLSFLSLIIIWSENKTISIFRFLFCAPSGVFNIFRNFLWVLAWRSWRIASISRNSRTSSVHIGVQIASHSIIANYTSAYHSFVNISTQCLLISFEGFAGRSRVVLTQVVCHEHVLPFTFSCGRLIHSGLAATSVYIGGLTCECL